MPIIQSASRKKTARKGVRPRPVNQLTFTGNVIQLPGGNILSRKTGLPSIVSDNSAASMVYGYPGAKVVKVTVTIEPD